MSGLLFFLAFVPMILEARLSARHDAILRSRGASEPAGDVYRLMQVCYPGAFLAMLIEGWFRSPDADGLFSLGIALFTAAKALKYWAIATLQERWTFRVLVPPGSSPVRRGPYRVLNHPNYGAVVGELAGFALMTQAWLTGPLTATIFVLLIRARIGVEERALGRIRPGVHHGR
jgi:methyltransferase